ncbi:hypothetical protein PpBr36_04687 [Pyricularia pennisetigena]|uniref:hypothetical protein n=1 Tax=Pyricularia pennisetigena TaxID=1578925 RepID=UPI0011518A1B|nr:hypothetical protein PpBr36_04687 [Pyricularia pennisetigena]TLS27333.1 hypothetical protein PpBr36_04687 [Pyricularia pennisetigena]
MSPRLAPFQSLARQCRSFMCEQTAKFSSTLPAARLVEQSTSSGSKLLNQMDAGRSETPANAIKKYMWSAEARERNKNDYTAKHERTQIQLRKNQVASNYLRQSPRRWNQGELYSPHDLSPEELSRFRKPTRPKFDVIDVLGINPLDEYQNFSMISEFMTPMGRIKHSKETCLRPVNQRKIAKAIRRAVGLGLHPSVHHHPELLRTRYASVSASGRRSV